MTQSVPSTARAAAPSAARSRARVSNGSPPEKALSTRRTCPEKPICRKWLVSERPTKPAAPVTTIFILLLEMFVEFTVDQHEDDAAIAVRPIRPSVVGFAPDHDVARPYH